ncbi:MAG: acyl-CoA carboxylase subunit beta, partial [Marinomonas sp.]
EAMIAKQERRIKDIFESQESAFFTSGRCLDNGVIDPRDSRKVLGFALETIFEAKNRTLHPNAFGVARI